MVLYSFLFSRFTDNQSGGALTRAAATAARNLRNADTRSADTHGNDIVVDAFDDVQPPGHRFELISERVKNFRTFKTRGRECTLKIKSPPSNIRDHLQWISGALRDIMTHITSTCQAQDHVGITLQHEDFSAGPVWSRFRTARDS